jgi:isopenicillin-N N-acyltransferase-like protein
MCGFPLIEMEGQPFERGRQYGAAAEAAIGQNVAAYLNLIEFHVGLTRDRALARAEAFGPILERHAPDLLEEMRGIAAGAGCELVDVLLINTRSELMGTMDACTSLAAAPEVTDRGRVLLGQNWDWYPVLEPEPVLLQIRQPDKPEILTLTEAGQVGKIGLNSAGLGVCLNFLSHRDRGQGVPVHVILRRMLECAHLGAAIRAAYGVPRGGAANVLLAHADGEILDLELTAREADFLYGDGGWLVHANHFESVRLRGGDTGLPLSMSSLARSTRARRLLSAAAGKGRISTETFQAILRDHAHGSYAICRHAEPTEPPLEQTATRASAIMDLTARTLSLAPGQPCSEPYQTFTLSDRL